MTKFILHGGNTQEINPDNKSFFREIALGMPSGASILLNYFSREDTDIERCAEQDKQSILKNSKNKDLVFEIAKPKLLGKQLQRARVMYMRGGNTKKLVAKISLTPNFSKLIQNKVIAGSSAGVYVLSKYYWSNNRKKIENGLGILNIKAYCHYKPTDVNIVNKLLAHKEKLPLLVLPNYRWMVLYL